jgi:outer membrane protein assembly factor BamD (BamD/ComL family)
MAKKQTSKAEQDLETYLRLYPAGFYASDAKAMLKNIK